MMLRYNSYCILFVIFIKTLANGISIVIPLISKNIIDSITIKHDYEFLQKSIIIILCIIFLYIMLSVLSNYFSTKYFLNLESKNRKDFFGKILRRKITFFSKYRQGEILYYFDSDLNIVLSSWKTLLETVPVQLVLLFSSIFFMIKWNFLLAVIVALLIVLQSFVIIVFKKPMLHMQQNYQKSAESMNSFLIDSLNRINIIKEFLGYGIEEKQYAYKLCDYVEKSLKIKVLNQLSSVLLNSFGNFWTMMIIWYGGKEVISNNMTMGQLFAFMMYANILASPINFLVNYVLSIQSTRVSFARITNLLSYPSELSTIDVTVEGLNHLNNNLDKSFWEIEVNELAFSHSNMHNIFYNFSCRIPSKGLTLLFGPSGSGKSTLCKLLIGYYDWYKGNIKINGIEINKIPVDYLRNNIVYLNQNQYIVNGTIIDNLTYGSRSDLNENEIYDIIKSTSSDFLLELPNGLKTAFNDNGFNVSQGQAQRIAITRALLKKPKILILDEPTSSIDSLSERIIYETLNNIKRDCCIILVSHDEKAKCFADNIVEINRIIGHDYPQNGWLAESP